MSDPSHRRAASCGTTVLCALVALVVAVGCPTRHAGRDTRSVSSPAGDGALAGGDGATFGDSTAAGADGAAAPTGAAEADAAGVAQGPTFLLAAEAGRLLVRGPDGEATVLELQGEATYDGAAWASGPLAWQREEGALVAASSSGAVEWRVRVETDEQRPVLTLRVAVRYAVDTTIEHEALVLRLPEATAPEALDRDFVLRPVEPGTTHLTDPWTPLELHAETPAGPLTVVRAGGFPSATSAATGAGLVVRLELDDAGNHPFRPYAECSGRYARNHPRETLDATPRPAGERVEHAAELWLGETTSLRAGRFPEGRRAAVVLTSHADQASAVRTRAVLWGHSDRDHATFGRRGLLAKR